jgi:small multidrug resistance pump
VAWLCLVLAILFEVSGTTSMKLSRSFTETGPTIAIFVFYGVSIFFLTLAVARIEIGIAYAVWSALGTAIVATIGIVAFGESASPWKLACLALIVAGVVGLHVQPGSAPDPSASPPHERSAA